MRAIVTLLVALLAVSAVSLLCTQGRRSPVSSVSVATEETWKTTRSAINPYNAFLRRAVSVNGDVFSFSVTDSFLSSDGEAVVTTGVCGSDPLITYASSATKDREDIVIHQLDGKQYNIAIVNGVTTCEEVEHSGLRCGGPVLVQASMYSPELIEGNDTPNAATTVIDVLYVPTTKTIADVYNNDKAAALNKFRASIASANGVLVASKVTSFRWNVAGMFVTPWEEPPVSGTASIHSAALHTLYKDTDVLSARKLYGADQVVIEVSTTNDAAGLAFQPGIFSVSQEHMFSAVVKATDVRLLAHELAHNFGCGHDRITSNQVGNNIDYNYGHTFSLSEAPSYTFGTIMAYYLQAGSGFFSNPDVEYKGVPLGIKIGQTNAANNSAVIQDNGPIISRMYANSNKVSFATHPKSRSLNDNESCVLSFTATGTFSHIQWRRNGVSIPNANSSTMTLVGSPAVSGIYDVVISSDRDIISYPATIGYTPATRAAGDVYSTADWQNITHPNGNVYDQFLLTGAVGTFSAEGGKIARMSFLDGLNSIVQVEVSGRGFVTVTLENPVQTSAVLYNQPAITYTKGGATIVLAGADESTHFTIYSVGKATNRAVTLESSAYFGWASVSRVGIVSANGKLGGLHQGNVLFNDRKGAVGVFADTVTSAMSTLVIHDIFAEASSYPALLFSDSGSINIKVAGGALTNSKPIIASGVLSLAIGQGMSSNGELADATPGDVDVISKDGVSISDLVVVRK